MPTYWFLGLFQQCNGTMRPEFVPLARRAWVALGFSMVGAAGALLLSYFRMLPRIVEQPEILPAARSLALPLWTRGGLKQAVTLFSFRTLGRSRQHRVILSFYLGIGLAIVVGFGKATRIPAATTATPIPLTSLLASVLMMLLTVPALRVVVAMPISLNANWTFRLTQVRPAQAYCRAVRFSWLVLTVIPVLVIVGCLFLPVYPRIPVLLHLSVLLAVGLLIVELCLATFLKVPFTCSYLPGKANIHFVFWATLFAMIWLLRKALEWEERLLERPLFVCLLAGALAILAGGIALVTEWRSRKTDVLVFEETYGEEVVTLDLRG
jgi:hypothetical protein